MLPKNPTFREIFLHKIHINCSSFRDYLNIRKQENIPANKYFSTPAPATPHRRIYPKLPTGSGNRSNLQLLDKLRDQDEHLDKHLN